MLTHFWDADGVDLHIVSLQTHGAFKPGETIQIYGNPHLITRMDRRWTTAGNESLHIYARMVTS